MSQGFEQFKVQELRAALVRAGFSQEDADSIKGKTSLVEAITIAANTKGVDPLTLMVGDDEKVEDVDFTQVELEDSSDVFDETSKPSLPEGHVPLYNDPEWSDYVMSKFAEGEIYDGNPTVPGLRRVAEELLGPMVFAGPIALEAQHPDNPEFIGRASCIYEVTFEWFQDLSQFTSEEDIINNRLPKRTFRAAAGSNQNNTDVEFAIYPEAMAETRAEARALRKALGLKNVVANEELTKNDAEAAVKKSVVVREQPVSFFDAVNDDKIKPNQKLHIEAMCKKLGIDVDKFINLQYHDGRASEPAYASIDEVPKDIAGSMIAELTKYQSETGNKESRNIPDVILLEN